MDQGAIWYFGSPFASSFWKTGMRPCVSICEKDSKTPWERLFRRHFAVLKTRECFQRATFFGESLGTNRKNFGGVEPFPSFPKTKRSIVAVGELRKGTFGGSNWGGSWETLRRILQKIMNSQHFCRNLIWGMLRSWSSHFRNRNSFLFPAI